MTTSTTAPTLETWLYSMDRVCLTRVLSGFGYPVSDKLNEEEVRDALRTAVMDGHIDISDRVTLAA